MVCSGFDEELTQRIRTELGELRSFMLEGTVRVAVDDHGNVDVEAATFPVDARLMPLHEAVRKSLIKKTF